MGSSVHMGRWVVLLLLAELCAVGCGRRTILEADADRDSDEASDGGVMLYACGRGKRPCDPEDLNGKTCEALGLGGGELSCNPSTCNFDLKDCTVGGVRIGSPQPTVDGGTSGRGGAGRGGAGAGMAGGLFGGAAGAAAGAPSNAGGLFGTGAAAGTGGGTLFGGGNNTADAGAFFGGGLFGGAADGGAFFGGGFPGGGPNDAGVN